MPFSPVLGGQARLLPIPSTTPPTPRRRLRYALQLAGAAAIATFLLTCPLLAGRYSVSSTIESLSPDDLADGLSPPRPAPRPYLVSASQSEDDEGRPDVTTPADKPEAYVTFLSSVTDSHYLLSTRLLIHKLLHDPLTADTSTPRRDVVVLTTLQIGSDVEDVLVGDGAKVRRVDLLDGFPVPESIRGEENHHWKDQYTKLHLFNMTDYSRVLYLDNDVLLLKSLEPIWSAPGSELVHGLAGVGERRKDEVVESDKRVEPSSGDEERSYLNAGFMLLRPDRQLFDTLREVRGYQPFYMEQALLNHYFDWDGEHPWQRLDRRFVSHFPKGSDIQAGYFMLHAKMWKDPVDEAVKTAWRDAVGRMEGAAAT
ncbi:hypothetical protein IAU60_000715 [Kwoniella sp. DSM 27419]